MENNFFKKNQTSNEFLSLKEKIKSFFEKQSYYDAYNFDICVTIVIIFIVIFIVFYIYINTKLKLEKLNWENNKCNPFYMPFASRVNTGGGSKSNEDNFKNCLNGLTSNIAYDVLSPINAIFNMISEFFKFIAMIFSQLVAYTMFLINRLIGIFKELMLILEKITTENIVIFSKINNFIASILGFISLIYYTIILLVDSVKLMFPMMAMSFLMGVVIPTIVSLSISIFILGMFVIIASFPFGCFGCWAWPFAASWLVVVIFLTIFLILVIIFYTIFARACNDILVRILAPISNSENIGTIDENINGDDNTDGE